MLIKEYRIVMPMSVEEYRIGQLYSVAKASKIETGGGEGVEIVANEPFEGEPQIGKGQYTHKIYHLASKVPRWVRILAPRGSLEFKEESWNGYPLCKTVVSNPEYMKDKFSIQIDSLHMANDAGTSENALQLTPEELGKREVIHVDIVNDPIRSADYKPEEDPNKFKSEKTGRGPLQSSWKESQEPLMCIYKVVKAEFIWFGLQDRVEKFILSGEQRLFTNFHRQVFCWLDEWHGLTMENIRAMEEKTKDELDLMRATGSVTGMVATE